MKKNINILSFVMIMCIPSFHAMELERIFTLSSTDGYESLAYDTLHDIYAQQYRMHPMEVDCDVTSFSLKNMYGNFSEMSDDYKCVVMRNMSTQLLLLSCVATCLPPELVRNICLLMMDGEIAFQLTQKERDKLRKEIDIAADEFYTTPIGEAFDQYYPINVWLVNNNSNAPIGPLYVTSHDKRDVMLGIKSSWYSSIPVVSYDGKKSVNRLDRDLKYVYLQGKEVVVTSKPYTKTELCVATAVLLGGPCSFGLCIGCGAAIGAVCCGNPGCILTKSYLLMFGSASGLFSALSCVFYSCAGLADVTNLKRMTI